MGSTTSSPDFTSPEWMKMFGESTYQYLPDDDELAEHTASELQEADAAQATAEEVQDAMPAPAPLPPVPLVPKPPTMDPLQQPIRFLQPPPGSILPPPPALPGSVHPPSQPLPSPSARTPMPSPLPVPQRESTDLRGSDAHLRGSNQPVVLTYFACRKMSVTNK